VKTNIRNQVKKPRYVIAYQHDNQIVESLMYLCDYTIEIPINKSKVEFTNHLDEALIWHDEKQAKNLFGNQEWPKGLMVVQIHGIH
jgi:hypothetical protein